MNVPIVLQQITDSFQCQRIVIIRLGKIAAAMMRGVMAVGVGDRW